MITNTSVVGQTLLFVLLALPHSKHLLKRNVWGDALETPLFQPGKMSSFPEEFSQTPCPEAFNCDYFGTIVTGET
jgi:hypothetical protein